MLVLQRRVIVPACKAVACKAEFMLFSMVGSRDTQVCPSWLLARGIVLLWSVAAQTQCFCHPFFYFPLSLAIRYAVLFAQEPLVGDSPEVVHGRTVESPRYSSGDHDRGSHNIKCCEIQGLDSHKWILLWSLFLGRDKIRVKQFESRKLQVLVDAATGDSDRETQEGCAPKEQAQLFERPLREYWGIWWSLFPLFLVRSWCCWCGCGSRGWASRLCL